MRVAKPFRIDVFDKDCVPIIGTKYSAGFDLKADIKSGFNANNLDILPGQRKQIPTGVSISLGNCKKYHMFVACKSGLGVKQSLWVGEHLNDKQLWINVVNGGEYSRSIKHGQPIAQVVVAHDTTVKKLHLLHLSESISIKPNEQMLVPVSSYYQLAADECGIISSVQIHDKLSLFPGVIDSDFCGQLKIYCMNESEQSKHFEKGTSIAVLLQLKIVNCSEFFDIINHYSKTYQQFDIVRKERGTGGFGSTE